MKKELITKSKQETQRLAVDFLNWLGNENVVLLFGDLGAGKTTFAQGVLETLGAKGPFTSPTFVVMKEYALEGGKEEAASPEKVSNSKAQVRLSQFKRVYHWDCYRIDDKSALELGWEEIIRNRENLVLVEWPEKIKTVWPESFAKMEFELVSESERKVSFVKI